MLRAIVAPARKSWFGLLAAFVLALSASVGFAAEEPGSVEPGAAEPSDTPASSAEPINAEPAEVAEAEPTLLGDMGGVRPALDKYGIGLELGYIGETFGVVHGGVNQGIVYEGQASAGLSFDLEKMLGWPGARVYANALQIHGRGPSRTLVGGNLMTVSNIEALPTTRLYRLYFEQSLFDDRASVRLGQIAADDEFLTSDTAGGLINGTFGWPAWTAEDVRGGGPAYPLPQLGVRLQVKPAPDFVLRGAVFTGNPGGKNCASGEPQQCDPHGVLFPFSAGTLWIGEVAYSANSGKGAAGIPGVYKLGGWYETGPFPGQFDPAVSKNNNGGVYAVVDQGIWRRQGSDDQGLNFFLRAGGGPSDRNLISFYADAGIGFRAPFVSRPDDVVTLGAAYGNISVDAARADRRADPPVPVRNYEAAIELSYKASVMPGWSVQPDLQYLFNPGGNVENPKASGTIPNAFVLGVRTTLAF
ncbi:MAG: carbohydrate porin [Alphaproteobacteria bacterium]